MIQEAGMGEGLCFTASLVSLPYQESEEAKGKVGTCVFCAILSTHNTLYVMDISHRDVRECWGEPMGNSKLCSI